MQTTWYSTNHHTNLRGYNIGGGMSSSVAIKYFYKIGLLMLNWLLKDLGKTQNLSNSEFDTEVHYTTTYLYEIKRLYIYMDI